MYNVLLVDDEDLDLEALRRFIPWEQLNMNVVGTMNSAVSALKYINQAELDILITDIRMPQISGLELAKLAQERNSNIRIVFISGYADFTYAKQALSLNAFSYLLKPVNDEEVYETLTKVKELLDRERSQQKAEKAYKEIAPLLRNELIVQLLEGNTPDNPLFYEECGLPLVFEYLRVAVIEIDDANRKLSMLEETKRNEILKTIMSTMVTECRKHGYHAAFPISSYRMAVIYEDEVAFQDDQWVSVASAIRSHSSYSVTVGVSQVFAEANRLSVAYRQAVQALEYKMFLGKDRIILFSEIKLNHPEITGSLDAQIEDLFLAIRSHAPLLLHARIDTFFEYIKSIQSRVTIYHALLYVVVKLDTWLHTLSESLLGLLDIHPQHLEIIRHFETIDDMQIWLRTTLFELSELLHLKKQKKNQKLSQEVITYIHAHIHEVITLRNAANTFSYTPNYLGLIFKEETGIAFTDYVIQVRLLKARELLMDTNLKIYEVADKVGYRNLNYFSKQFKETFQVSPLEFRRQS